jgi:hypothetical protein
MIQPPSTTNDLLPLSIEIETSTKPQNAEPPMNIIDAGIIIDFNEQQ